VVRDNRIGKGLENGFENGLDAAPGRGPMMPTTARARARGARGFWPLRDLPVVLWLMALLGAALVHPVVPAPRWLLIHLLLLGAVGHAILVWSRHFADALLHTPTRDGDRRWQSIRLLVFNTGVVLVVLGVLGRLWPVTVGGAAAVGAAPIWHGAALAAQARRALPARFSFTVRYYVAAACFLPAGAALGTLLARGLPDPLNGQVKLAHVAVNVLGWMGLTVAGTVVTLWPTMLHTRVSAGCEVAARRALPVLVVSVLVIAGGALGGLRPVAAVGLGGYLVGLGLIGGALFDAGRRKPPSSFPAWSVAAALAWWTAALAALAVGVAALPSWPAVDGQLAAVTPLLAAGFGAQLLLGALSYLVPVVLGGGPSRVRSANAALARGGPLRLTAVNAGLLVCALPVPSVVRVLCSAVVLAGLAAFIPLLFLAIRTHRADGDAAPARAAAGPLPQAPRAATGQVSVGLAAVVLAVAAGVAADPAAVAAPPAAGSASVGVPATGRTTTVTITARGMRFVPDTVQVPVGNRLVIELSNGGDDVHDLVLDSGNDSGRLAPGRSARLDVGVVGRDIEGWCSVIGHRQMGMVLHVTTTGGHGAAVGSSRPGAGSGRAPGADTGSSPALDLIKPPAAGWAARDATLPPAAAGTVHRHTFTVSDVVREVAPGVTQRLWTFNGTAPGPALHGRVGDVFEITLLNRGSIGHSIDFHAGQVAPDGPMRTILPGRSLVYRFTATRAGAWMYHCSTMPMSAHLANGLFGAVIIDPPGLPPVDRSYVLVQSELYLGPQAQPVDVTKLQAERPDAVVFNGYADQYDHAPLTARAGERVRIWVLDAGPSRPSSFHVVGAQFDTVYAEGGYLLGGPGQGSPGGAQALALAPAQGGFVETTFPEPGRYPFLTHLMVDAERGAHGVIDVAADPRASGVGRTMR
jgi:nitrite reductase (NO-forming)